MYDPQTSGSHFPLYTGTKILFLQSSRIQPSLKMLLIRSVIHLEPKPQAAFLISLTTQVGLAAFPIFNPLISAAASSSEMRPQGNPLHHPSHSQHSEVSSYTSSIYSSYHQHQKQHSSHHFSYRNTLMTYLPSLKHEHV